MKKDKDHTLKDLVHYSRKAKEILITDPCYQIYKGNVNSDTEDAERVIR